MTDKPDNVVFLKFSSPEQVEDGLDFMACRHCRNKTFTHIYDRNGGFPLVTCAACGQHIGRVGWAPDAETDTAGGA